jgi:hypothetical protein
MDFSFINLTYILLSYTYNAMQLVKSLALKKEKKKKKKSYFGQPDVEFYFGIFLLHD